MANDSASKGLADVVVSKTKITSIDGQSGKLFHCGYEISDLAKNSNFENSPIYSFMEIFQAILIYPAIKI